MTFKELLKLYNQGIHPIIRFNSRIEKYGNQFEKHMLAKIVDININTENDDYKLFSIKFDETIYKDYNKSIETQRISSVDEMKKWSEINKRYDEYKINLFYNNLEDKSDYFELANIKSQRLLHEYLNIDTNMSYIDWLQEQVLTLRILK